MSTEKTLATLREVAFLSGIADEHLETLAEVAQVTDYEEGKQIFREGEPASNVFLIVSGKVSLEIGAPGVGRRRILTAGEGELLSWSPILEQTRLTATARTLAPTRVIELNGGQIVTLCEHNPRFGYIFMRRAALAISKRLSATRMQLLDVFGTEMPAVTEQEKNK